MVMSDWMKKALHKIQIKLNIGNKTREGFFCINLIHVMISILAVKKRARKHACDSQSNARSNADIYLMCTIEHDWDYV